jgi:hypothetical protein
LRLLPVANPEIHGGDAKASSPKKGCMSARHTPLTIHESGLVKPRKNFNRNATRKQCVNLAPM